MASIDSNHHLENQPSEGYVFRKRKVFNDPIHGQIELHPVCVRIIDTPQFQRLRHIKQLDACYLVYPGASHNRFEHSIGTCHLAGKLMRTLQRRQPREKIEERDILCVEIAALCHDLGQGPFSHIFEKRFMPKIGKEFTHERTAKKMFEYLLEDNDGRVKRDIQTIIRDCGKEDFVEFTDRDFLFIKEMIDKPKKLDKEPWPYEGRGEEKSFMYEIVANKRNGIDVDKWDYLARDSYMLGMKVSFEHDRCIMSARILKGNGSNGSDAADGNAESNDSPRRKQICYREKNANDLYDMFYARMTLHRRAYQHKTHRIIGIMLMEALIKANESVMFQGRGRLYRISDAVDDMKAFTQLTDDVFLTILNSPTASIAVHSSDIEEVNRSAPSHASSVSYSSQDTERVRKNDFIEAKKILNNIVSRNLLKYVTGTQGEFIDEKEFEKTFKQSMKLQENTNVYHDVIVLDYGMKDKNPLENVRFYRKENDEHSIKLQKNQVSFVLPENFSESILSIYCENVQHDRDAPFKQIREEFEKWCKDNNLPDPKGSRRQDQNTVPKSVESSDRNTVQTRERQESDSDQQSRDENLELKRLAEPNTVSGNEDQQGSIFRSTIVGVDIRPQDTFVSGEDNNSSQK